MHLRAPKIREMEGGKRVKPGKQAAVTTRGRREDKTLSGPVEIRGIGRNNESGSIKARILSRNFRGESKEGQSRVKWMRATLSRSGGGKRGEEEEAEWAFQLPRSGWGEGRKEQGARTTHKRERNKAVMFSFFLLYFFLWGSLCVLPPRVNRVGIGVSEAARRD